MLRQIDSLTFMMIKERERWQEMMDACYDPSTPSWQFNGRHGVIVDSAWHTFEGFIKDVGPMPGLNSMLDRSPGTDCFTYYTTAWRQGTERQLRKHGCQLTLSQWATQLNIPKGTITSRIRKNLPIDMVLSPTRLARKNLDGMRFGMLTVISHRFNRRSLDFWKCKCDCGKHVTLASSMLHTNRVRSCGCIPSLSVKLCDITTKLQYLNKTRKITEWSGVVGIQASLIAKRIRAGWTAGEALGYDKKVQQKGARRLSYLTGVPESTIRHRKNIGVSTRELAYTSDMQKGKLWTYDGLTMTLGQWASHLGENEATLRSRLYNNWPISDVLKYPSRRLR
jgi:hypothetical protein